MVMRKTKIDKPPTSNDDDLRMIQEPSWWTLWPYLPMKRRTTTGKSVGVEVGFMIAADGYRLTVFRHNVLTLPKAKTVSELIQKLPNYQSYPTPEALLADGWMVD
jgi:hypothetical protein